MQHWGLGSRGSVRPSRISATATRNDFTLDSGDTQEKQETRNDLMVCNSYFLPEEREERTFLEKKGGRKEVES